MLVAMPLAAAQTTQDGLVNVAVGDIAIEDAVGIDVVRTGRRKHLRRQGGSGRRARQGGRSQRPVSDDLRDRSGSGDDQQN
jgi:hypothetical protein